MKYYRDNNGKYLGAFDGTPPPGAIESSAPPHAKSVWNGTDWSEVVQYTTVHKEEYKTYLYNIGKMDEVYRVLEKNHEAYDQYELEDTYTTDQIIIHLTARILGTDITTMVNNMKTTTVQPAPVKSDLDMTKEVAKAMVDSERDKRKFSNVTYKGNQYTVSEWDILMIMSLLTSASSGNALPTGEYWRTANNVNVNLSNSDLNNLDALIRTQIQNAYVYSWTKKALIEQATTVAEVEAIDLELSQ